MGLITTTATLRTVIPVHPHQAKNSASHFFCLESEDCYKDGALDNLPIERDDGGEMTVEYCLTWCRNSNYKLAGIKEGKYCIGTDGSIDLTKEVEKTECNSECLVK